MKTVFKVGMKVYDQVFFPDTDGKIVEIHNKNDKIQLEVKFFSKYRLEPLCMQSSVFYTEKGNMINFCAGINCKTSTLSTEPYKVELQGFEQKAPVPTFEEAWKKTMRLYEPKSEYNKEEYKGYPSQELADASEALRRLLFLRDYYNDGWKPDKKDKEQRGVSVTLDCDNNFMVWGILKETEPYKFIFKNDETAEKFLEEQRELLEIAKPLL